LVTGSVLHAEQDLIPYMFEKCSVAAAAAAAAVNEQNCCIFNIFGI